MENSVMNPFIITNADSDFNKALNNLCNAAPKFGFNVVHIHNMKETFVRNSIEFENDYCIVEICSPEKASKALSIDFRLGNMMPKHIIVFRDIDGINKYMMMKADPEKVAYLFPDTNIANISNDVMKSMQELIHFAKGSINEL